MFCRKECKFKLRVEITTELNLKPGKMFRLYFKENQQRILRFEIPNDPQIEEVVIKGISEDLLGNFEMLVLRGNEVPDTSKALFLGPAWENGYIGKFTKNCFCFCTNCNYTVLVSSKSDTYIQVGAKVSG